MKSTKVLCNDEGESVIKFGYLICPERDLPSGHNLANYVDKWRFNLLEFLTIINCSSPIYQWKVKNVWHTLFLKITVLL